MDSPTTFLIDHEYSALATYKSPKWTYFVNKVCAPATTHVQRKYKVTEFHGVSYHYFISVKAVNIFILLNTHRLIKFISKYS